MSRLGDYELQGELARGGMGVVYRARHVALGREVVIKLVLGALDPEAVKRFEREAEALARVAHPNVVGVHELGRDPAGRPFLALDRVDGGTLQARLDAEGPLPVAEAARLVERLAAGVEAAHAQGVLHRDLKPENVLLTREGEPVLTDFGLARLEGRDTQLTLTGEVVGTPVFMPPEQANGDRERIGPASDVYGLGALLYALLTGQPPFRGAHLVSVLHAVLSEPPRPVRELRPEVDPALAAIVDRCLAKQPRDRYPSAAALGEVLAAWRRGTLPCRGRLGAGLLLAGVGVLVAGAALWGQEDPAGLEPALVPATSKAPSPARPLRTVTIQPGPLEGVDTYVHGAVGRRSANYGCERELHVGRARGQVVEARALFRFALDRYLPPSPGARIERATLELTAQDPNWERSAGLPIVVHWVEEPWIEGTNGRASVFGRGTIWGADTVGIFTQQCPPQPRVAKQPAARAVARRAVTTIDVTQLVAQWVKGRPNHGLRLSVPPDRDGLAVFWSSDGPPASRPRLRVEYRGDPPPAPPDPIALRQQADTAPWIARLEQLRDAPLRERMGWADEVIARAPHDARGYLLRAALLTEAARQQGASARRRHDLYAFKDTLLGWHASAGPADRRPLAKLLANAALRTGNRRALERARVLLRRRLASAETPRGERALLEQLIARLK